MSHSANNFRKWSHTENPRFWPLVAIVSLLTAASTLAQTNISDPPTALADNLQVDKTWLSETLRPLLAALVVFLMLVLGIRFVQSTSARDHALLGESDQTRGRLANVARNLGGDFWAVAAIVLLMSLVGFYRLFFIVLFVVYAGLRIAYLLLREHTIYQELARQKAERNDTEQAQLSEIDEFFSRLKEPKKPGPKKTVTAGPIRVEVRAKPKRQTLESEQFLASCLQENSFFCSLPAARRKPLSAEFVRKLHLRWKEFEIRTDSLYLNRQDPSGGVDQVCVLTLPNGDAQARGILINAGFLHWALGIMLTKHDLVYETDEHYHAPDETERGQIALLPESRRPKLLSVKEIVNPWHAMIGL